MEATGELPFAYGGPPLLGTLRSTPEDFVVDEELGFSADGAGEHAFVRIEKRGANTDWVARELAKFARVTPDAVSFAGMKDRHAITRQTFSIHLPGKADPAWANLQHPEFRVIASTRHSRKLKRGTLQSNSFEITLRDVDGDRDMAQRCLVSMHDGVPNYFGEQRFGRDGGNVDRARALFAGGRVQRHERSIALSAARSYLFNSILAMRVERANWNAPLSGEVFMLDGTHSIFGPEPMSQDLLDRYARHDIDLTGPLWGEGNLRPSGQVLEIESSLRTQHGDLTQGLESNGLRQERRALRLRAQEFAFEWIGAAELRLRFRLNSGSYATAFIRELVSWRDPRSNVAAAPGA